MHRCISSNFQTTILNGCACALARMWFRLCRLCDAKCAHARAREFAHKYIFEKRARVRVRFVRLLCILCKTEALSERLLRSAARCFVFGDSIAAFVRLPVERNESND